MRPESTGFIMPCHAGAIDAIRHRYGHTTSSHAFNTLYIWRNVAGKQLHLEAELFSLRYEGKGVNTWLFPCGDREAACRFIERHMEEPDFALCYLRAEDAALLEERFPGRFILTASPGDSEYIVDAREHTALVGKHFEKLRNKVRRAERDHVLETQPLTKANLTDALKVIGDWHGNRTQQGNLHLYGDEEDPGALLQMELLKFTGIVLYADGKPYGAAAGFILCGDTFDLALAKDAGHDSCLGYYLRRELMRSLPENLRWVNLEDDLDIEGLRTMKKQMLPVRMNDMWMAVQKK